MNLLLVPFHTCRDGQGTGLHLVSHLPDSLWGWSYKHHPCVCARLGKVCPLREETVAWVDGIHFVVLRRERGIDGEKVIYIHYISVHCTCWLRD